MVSIFLIIFGFIEFLIRFLIILVCISFVFPIAIILDDDGIEGVTHILSPVLWQKIGT